MLVESYKKLYSSNKYYCTQITNKPETFMIRLHSLKINMLKRVFISHSLINWGGGLILFLLQRCKCQNILEVQ